MAGCGCRLLRQTFDEWREDHALEWGAALSFYAMLSLAPFVVVLLGVVGVVLGRGQIETQIVQEAEKWMGHTGARALGAVVANAQGPRGDGVVAIVVGTVGTVIAATGVFAQLQRALNHMWQVEAAPGKPFRRILKNRLSAFVMVFACGALLLLFSLAGTVIAAASSWMQLHVPGGIAWALVLESSVSLVVATTVFAGIFKLVPDARVRWREVGVGAVVTGLLFTAGRLLLNVYLSRAFIVSAYGAAGSLVVLLLWVYYTAQVLLLGAELTQVWARRHGNRIEPSRGAVRVVRGARKAEAVQAITEPRHSPRDEPPAADDHAA